MGERPPVRAILEDVTAHRAVARHRKQRGPLIDGDAGVVGLHEAHAAQRAAVELHDVGHAADPVADQAREDAPLALGPWAVVAIVGREEALRVATALARRHRFAKYLDVLAGGHLQPPAAENAVDLLGRHRSTCKVGGSPSGDSRCAAALSAANHTSAHAATAISVAIGIKRASRARDALRAMHDQHRGIVLAAVRARELDEAHAAARERRRPAQEPRDVARPGVPVHAVAAQDEHFVVGETDAADVGRVDRAVADHACRVVGRPAQRRFLVQVPVRVVHGEELRRRLVRRAQAIDAAVADPGDEPPRQRRIRPRA